MNVEPTAPPVQVARIKAMMRLQVAVKDFREAILAPRKENVDDPKQEATPRRVG